MAANGAGFSESIVHAPISNQKSYSYRSKMGMVPSAEFDVWMDDFHSFVVATAITNGPVANTPWNWQSATIDAAATAAIDTTAAIGANGVIKLTSANVSEGVTIWTNKSFQLTVGKRFFMEIRVRTDDVTDNALQFGLADQSATTNPEDFWLTASNNFIAFGIKDGAATTTLFADKANSGSTVEATGTRSMVASTWHTLAIAYDGISAVRGFLDGNLSQTWSQAFATTVPTGTAMGAFIGHINGDGAGNAANYVDYIRVCSER